MAEPPLVDDVQPRLLTNWTGVPNFGDGYGTARSEIVKRVEALPHELAASSRKKH